MADNLFPLDIPALIKKRKASERYNTGKAEKAALQEQPQVFEQKEED